MIVRFENTVQCTVLQHDQYREREDVMFDGRVIRNCQKNRWQGWGEPGRLR